MKEYLKAEVNVNDHDLISAIDELPLWSAPFGMKLLETIELKKNINVLDIGCGLGFPLIELSQRLGNTCQIYGIDPWDEALERVRLKTQVYNIKNVKIVNGYAEDMPFEDKYFDLLVSNNGINNVQDIKKTLNQCFRVSKPNSQFTFTLNTQESMHEFYSEFQNVLEEEGMNEEVLKMKKHIYSKRKPVEEIEKLTEEAGFIIKNISYDSFEFKYIDATAMLNHYVIKFWFLNSWKSILPENKMEQIFDKVEVRLNKLAENKDYLTLTIPFVTVDCRRK